MPQKFYLCVKVHDMWPQFLDKHVQVTLTKTLLSQNLQITALIPSCEILHAVSSTFTQDSQARAGYSYHNP